MKRFGLTFESNVTNVTNVTDATNVTNDRHSTMFNETDDYVPYWVLMRGEQQRNPEINSVSSNSIKKFNISDYERSNYISGMLENLTGIELNLTDYDDDSLPPNNDPER